MYAFVSPQANLDLCFATECFFKKKKKFSHLCVYTPFVTYQRASRRSHHMDTHTKLEAKKEEMSHVKPVLQYFCMHSTVLAVFHPVKHHQSCLTAHYHTL